MGWAANLAEIDAHFRAASTKTVPKLGLDILYKNLYNIGVTSEGSKSRIKWEADTKKEIRSWPKDIKEDIGLELHRLDNFEEPLKSKPMGPSAPGIIEICEQDEAFWYRVLYALKSGWIYILHCFHKKTNQTSKNDLDLAKKRLSNVKLRDDTPAPKEEKSA
jgi:phage-related protein